VAAESDVTPESFEESIGSRRVPASLLP